MEKMSPEKRKLFFFGLFGLVVGMVAGFGAAMIFYLPRCICF